MCPISLTARRRTAAPQAPARKTAVVTGAASGLGRALSLRLTAAGWQVALADLDESGLRQTLAMVQASGGEAIAEQLDVTDAQAWRELEQRLRRHWTKLDLLVNNAGVSCAGEVGTCELEDWQWILDVNLCGVIYGCHTFVPWLKENLHGAHIVNVASVAAFASAPAMGPYNVAKAGVVSLSETLYAELHRDGVGVTCVCPGFFATNLLAGGRFTDDRQKQLADAYMQRARITADDVADAIVRAIRRKQLYVILPARARLLWRLKRWMPRTLLKLIAKGYARHVDRSPGGAGAERQPTPSQTTGI